MTSTTHQKGWVGWKLLICGLALAAALGISAAFIPPESALAAEADDEFELVDGYWMKSSNGKWWFEYEDGTYAVGATIIDDGYGNFDVYYFDKYGWMVTGWYKEAGKWYYFKNSGAMASGWQKVAGTWYYLDPEMGYMLTGWQQINGVWYYMNSSGAMKTGWQKVGKAWYYMNGSGAMQTGWKKLGGDWYYLKDSGAMATGWQQVDGAWYYMNGSGVMQANRWIGNYYVKGSGAMATNTWIGNYYVGDDGAWIKNATSSSTSNSNTSTVYWTPGGKSYHYSKDCASLKRSSDIRQGSLSSCPKSDPCNLCSK